MSSGIQIRAELLAYPLRLAFDCNLRRPGCVLLQALMGGSSQAASLFSTDLWLLSPTDGLKVYQVHDATMLGELIRMSTEANPNNPERSDADG